MWTETFMSVSFNRDSEVSEDLWDEAGPRIFFLKESRQGIKNQENGKWIGSYITTFYSNNNSCNSHSFSPTHTHTALVFMVSCFLTFPLTRMDPSGATLGSVSCQRILQHEDRRSLGVWDQFTDLPIGKQPTLPPESVK